MTRPFPTTDPPEQSRRKPFPRSSSTASRPVQFPSSSSSSSPNDENVHHDRLSPQISPPRHLLMRSRRISSPANLSEFHTVAGASNSYMTARPLAVSEGSGNRTSMASMTSSTSFDSLPEEDETDATSEGSASLAACGPRPPLLRRSVSPSRPGPLPRPVSFAQLGSTRPPNPKRNSLPTPPAFDGSYRPFSLGPAPLLRSSSRGRTSPLGRDDGIESTSVEGAAKQEERERREERRWKIAEELRETERAYVAVLEEIDAHYYQPLLAALPPIDPLHRRTSTRTSHPSAPTSPVIRPIMSPRASLYASQSVTAGGRSRTTTADSSASAASAATSTSSSTSASSSTVVSTATSISVGSLPILARKEVGEIFSNFTDVLNLAREMLDVLDQAIPDRPSKPVALSPQSSLARLPSLSPPTSTQSSPEPDLCSSAGTDDSDGLRTPREGDMLQGQDLLRRRTTSSSKRERRPHAPPLRVGKALLPILPFLKQYSLFISNFSTSLARLSGLEASLSAPIVAGINGTIGSSQEDRSRWQAFCEERKQMGAGRNLGLGGMLLGIVQRIPRYRLLLDDLVKYTELDHPDLRDLTKAFETVDKVASHLEAQIRSHTSDLHILDLQRSFVNLDAPLLAPGRRHLKTGQLRKLDRRGNEQTRTFFLFSDELVHASGGELGGWLSLGGAGEAVATPGDPRSHSGSGAGSGSQYQIQYKLHRRFPLQDITIVGEDSSEQGRAFGFQILSSEKSFAVYATSLDEKLAWVDAIREAKEELLRDRRTLQRDGESSSSASTPLGRANTTRRERRISLPATSAASQHRFLLTPQSTAPQLGVIPATPLEEPSSFLVESPTSFDNSKSPSTEPTHRERLQPISLTTSANESEPAATYPVIDDYSAPVWVPDSKAARCMKCSEAFAMWKRRHHCRLCGSVVCHWCSDNYFIIPSPQPSGPDTLARACTPCFFSVFPSPDAAGPPSPTSRRAPLPSPVPNILSPPSSPPLLASPGGQLVYYNLPSEGGIPAFSLEDGERTEHPSAQTRESKEKTTAREALQTMLKR